jgi:hypothetical protein
MRNTKYGSYFFNSPALHVTEALNVQVRDLNLEKKEINVVGGKKRKDNDIEPVPCNLQVLRQIKRYCDRIHIVEMA